MSGSPTERVHTVQYIKDKLHWSEFQTEAGNTTTITMENGETVYFRNKGSWNYDDGTNRFITKFRASENHNIGGNLYYLTGYGDNYNPGIIEGQKGVFSRVFQGDTKLIDASGITLSTLTDTSYSSSDESGHYYECMFDGCTSLVKGPSFRYDTTSAYSLSDYEFRYTFRNCSSLTDIGDLPGNNYGKYSYAGTFMGCTSLVYAPPMPNLKPSDHTFVSMYEGCTSLLYPPSIPSATPKTNSRFVYWAMFKNCTSLQTAPNLLATSVSISGYKEMFSGCTALVNAPEIALTSTSSATYEEMFSGCTSLVVGPVLHTQSLNVRAYYNMFNGCSSLTSITTYADNISNTDCLRNWLSGVAPTGTFHNLGSAVYPSGSSGIPSGWTETNS